MKSKNFIYQFSGRKFVPAPSILSRLALLALALTVPTLRANIAAQNQLNAEIQAIQPGKTIISCSASTLAAAVAQAIQTGSSSPINYALSSLEPYPAGSTTVRADRNTSAALVTSAAIKALVAGGDPNFQTDASGLVDSVCTVNGTNASENLAAKGYTGMGLVIKRALGTISDAYIVTTSSSSITANELLATDELIGQKLGADPALEALPGYTLVGLALNGIEGATGNGSAAPSAAPLAAQNFALGLVSSGTVPDAGHGMTFPAFAVYLLSQVNSNAELDELVTNSIASQDANTSASAHESALVTLGKALLGTYPNAQSKIVQGLAGAIPQGASSTGEDARVTFASDLETATGTHSVNILAGMVYADPFYAAGSASRPGFTSGIFNAVVAKSGVAGLLNVAPLAATAVGNVLGQDSAVLTEEASTYGDFIAAGELSARDAGLYARDLISGAQNGNVATTEFTGAAAGAGGGKLYLGATSTSTDISTPTVMALGSIVDVLADGIIRKFGVASIDQSPSTAATNIGILISAVTRFTTNETFTDTVNSALSGSVGVFEAATLDNFIVSLGLSLHAQAAILNTVAADAKIHVTNATDQSEIVTQETAAEQKNSAYVAIPGPLAGEETVCTNL